MKHLLIVIVFAASAYGQVVHVANEIKSQPPDTIVVGGAGTQTNNTTNTYNFGGTNIWRSLLLANDGLNDIVVICNGLNSSWTLTVKAGESRVFDRASFTNYSVGNPSATNISYRIEVSGKPK